MDNRQSFGQHNFRVGVFDIEPARNLVSRNRESQSLEPRIMDVLCVLASEPDVVHSRETLIQRVWQVEYGGDESLTRAIGVLRKTFRDAGEDVEYIETITKRGYRLTRPVTILEAASRAPAPVPDFSDKRRRKRALAGLAAFAVMVAAFIGYSIRSPKLNSVVVQSKAQLAEVETNHLSIAVLPFDDFSQNQDQEYFADGIAEEVLNLLVKSTELKVAGRTSSFQYKNKSEDLRTIGENLGVAHILEGSIRKAGDKLRVTAQLIRASDGFHIWSETYDGDVSDIFTVQENIASSIANSLQTSLGIVAGSQARARTDNIEAYEYYLRGLGYYAARGADGTSRFGDNTVTDAILSFEKAVALDPEFGAAWAGLSLTYVVAPGWLKTHQGHNVSRIIYKTKALYAANRAVELNPELAVTQHALANIMMQYFQWERTEDALLRALEIEPNSHVILEDYREFLTKVGRLDEALTISRKMAALEPQNVEYLYLEISSEAHNGNLELALLKLDRLIDLVKSDLSPEDLIYNVENRISILHALGRVGEAYAYFDNCTICTPEAKAHSLALLEQVENPDPDFQIEALQFRPLRYFTVMTGNPDLVIKAEQDNFAVGGPRAFYGLAYNYGNTASDPRYKPMLIDAGLVRYWHARGWPKRCRPVGDDDFECGEF